MVGVVVGVVVLVVGGGRLQSQSQGGVVDRSPVSQSKLKRNNEMSMRCAKCKVQTIKWGRTDDRGTDGGPKLQ